MAHKSGRSLMMAGAIVTFVGLCVVLIRLTAGQPLVWPISPHPFVIGGPYRIRRLRRALQHILGHGNRVWLTRHRDICSHVEALPAGIVPG